MKKRKYFITQSATCAVCWGYQQYDGMYKKLFRDKQLDINNHKSSDMLIRTFMKYQLDGVSLRDGDLKLL